MKHAESITSQPHRSELVPVRPVPSHGTLTVRVRYCECDPMGVAHHASYIPWLEMGRTELLRDSGVSYAQLEQAGIFLVITKLEVKYRRPLFYDDIVQVRTTVIGGSRVKIEHTYELLLAEDGGHGKAKSPQGSPVTVEPMTLAERSIGLSLAIASTQLACVGRDGRVQELPEWLTSR
ncbi:MAG: acyl-CoA thioesterase [Pyrinomonadaceae bacterium]|nr:acyl-CoA thioesterase [Phycisphaerales bacterium]